MKITCWKYVLFGVAALFALTALAGHPLVPGDAAIGLAVLPAMLGNVSPVEECIDLIKSQGAAWEEFKAVQVGRLNNLEKATRDIAIKMGRPFGLSGTESTGTAGDDEHKKAFDRYLRKGEAAGLADLQRKAMNSGTDPDGGYLVIPEMDAMIDRIAPTVSAMYREADTITISTSKWEKLVKTAGMAMRRVADGGTGGESTPPKYAMVSIEVHSSEVEPWVFNETLQDSVVNLAADLSDEAGVAFAEGGGAEFISGNGVGKSHGILSYPIVANSAYAWGSVGYIASGKTAAFASVAPGDKILNLVAALPSKYRANAKFMMSDATLNTVRQMKDGSGSYYLWQSVPTAPFGGLLLGHEVVIDENMPAISASSYSIAFADFKRAYKIINRAGTTLIRDDITEKGKTKFNFRRRFGGGIAMYEAIKLMKFATS